MENPALRALRQGLVVGLANHSVLIAKDGTEHAIDDSAAPIRVSVSTEAPAAEDPPKTIASRSQMRGVVVDNNRNQALSLQRLLQTMGHEVRVAYDGASAMKLLASFVPDFALIDLGLPRIDGSELARWLREQAQFRNMVLVAQTGWGREEDRQRARGGLRASPGQTDRSAADLGNPRTVQIRLSGAHCAKRSPLRDQGKLLVVGSRLNLTSAHSLNLAMGREAKLRHRRRATCDRIRLDFLPPRQMPGKLRA